jgi:hypothetical protein
MSDIKMGMTVSLAEAADMVEHVGSDVTLVFQGEMGMGKSSILSMLHNRLPDHRPVYADLPTFDVSDIGGAPFTELVNGMKVTSFAPNALLNLQHGAPVIFMADEIGKASRPVQNSILRLLHEGKVGEYSLPPGSIRFATTNLAAEGLGDMMQAHAMNRVAFVTVRKPNAEQWIPWAMANDIHPVVIAWVKRFPMCLDSYMDGVEGNPYIFYPGKTNRPFVSPRSLEKASYFMKKRHLIGNNAASAGVCGTVGDAAGTDLMSFATTYDRLASWEAIVATPDSAPVPEAKDFAANFVSVFSAISSVDAQSFTPWMTYCQRLPKEYQGVFAMNVLVSPKRNIAIENRPFVVWATQNHWLV